VGFPKAIAGSSITVSTSEVDVATGIKVPDGVGRSGSMVYFSPWIVDTAPSVAEGLGGVFSLAGNWPHSPTEVPSPVGGSHLGAIGARITTPRERWVINQPVSAGQEFDLKFEGFDAVASGARGGATFYYDLSTPSGPPISSKVARETQVSSAGETALADLSLEGAGQIIEFVPIVVPSGTTTADMEIAGRLIIRSDSLSPVNEISFDIEPFNGVEATSGQLSQSSLWRQEVRLVTNVPSVTLSSAFDLDVALTTQTAEVGYCARFIKRTTTPNPRA